MNRNSGVVLKAIVEHKALLSILEILDHAVHRYDLDGLFTIISNKVFCPQSKLM